MRIFYHSKFNREYKKLPLSVKLVLKAKQEIFLQNPFDPRLKTHKLHGDLEGSWAFRIDNQNRVIFEFGDNDIALWHSVGNHDIYE